MTWSMLSASSPPPPDVAAAGQGNGAAGAAPPPLLPAGRVAASVGRSALRLCILSMQPCTRPNLAMRSAPCGPAHHRWGAQLCGANLPQGGQACCCCVHGALGQHRCLCGWAGRSQDRPAPRARDGLACTIGAAWAAAWRRSQDRPAPHVVQPWGPSRSASGRWWAARCRTTPWGARAGSGRGRRHGCGRWPGCCWQRWRAAPAGVRSSLCSQLAPTHSCPWTVVGGAVEERA